MTNKQKQKIIDKTYAELKAILSPEYYDKVCTLIELEIEMELDSNQ